MRRIVTCLGAVAALGLFTLGCEDGYKDSAKDRVENSADRQKEAVEDRKDAKKDAAEREAEAKKEAIDASAEATKEAIDKNVIPPEGARPVQPTIPPPGN